MWRTVSEELDAKKQGVLLIMNMADKASDLLIDEADTQRVNFLRYLRCSQVRFYPYILFATSNLQDEKIIPVEKQNSNSPPRFVSASSNNSL